MSKNYEKDGVSQYFQLEGIVSNSFNRLKGKMFNLIEATITDKQQCEAVKGLIKGFANDEYTNCVSDMRYQARDMKLLTVEESEDFPPMSATPLDLLNQI
jgi:hypothetical protein